MLDDTDADRVKRWFAACISAAETKGEGPGLKSRLAQHCGVKPQAVTGWLKTGRISKSKLALASDFFKSAPDFLEKPGHVFRVAEGECHYGVHPRWPFQRIDARAVAALPADDLLRLEGAILLAAAQLGIDVKIDAAA